MAASHTALLCSAPPCLTSSRTITGASRSASASLSLGASSVNRTSFPTFSGSSATFTSSFLFPSSTLSSSFSDLSFELDSNAPAKGRWKGLVVKASKYTLCQTKRNKSRKSLARTHGFRRRMRTTSGRAILKRRRAKGRKMLCTKTNPSSGKRA